MAFLDFLKGIARSILKDELNQTANPKEDELNNKYPKVDMNYLRHETDGDYSVDVRNFYMIKDSNIPTVSGTDDEKALNSLKWVIDNIKYTPDSTSYKQAEYWAYPYQTLKHKTGDCEDGSILLANIMIRSGIPYWKVRITAGDVDDGKGNKGGHCFVVYYYEEGDYWVLLDWCYWNNTLKISQRKNYKDEGYYKEIWFSFNEKYVFSTDEKSASKILGVKKCKTKKAKK